MRNCVRIHDRVVVHYIGRVKGEDIQVESTIDDDEPFEFEVGSPRVIEGLSEAVMGMKKGEKCVVEVPVHKAFGPRQESLIVRIPRHKIPDYADVGDTLDELKTQHQWKILKLEEELAEIDGNHPYAGKSLVLEVELLEIKPQSKP